MNLLPFQLPLFPVLCVVLLNGQASVPLPWLPALCVFPANCHPRWRARVAGRWLWCCDDRVVKRCADHSPWVGGENTKFDPGGSGNCKQGGWGAPGCSKGCPHIQTVLASRRRRRPGRVVRKPLCKPRGGLHHVLLIFLTVPPSLFSCCLPGRPAWAARAKPTPDFLTPFESLGAPGAPRRAIPPTQPAQLNSRAVPSTSRSSNRSN